MMGRPRRIVRARQRSRSVLPAFTAALDPRFQQVGVDRVQIKLQGTWRVTSSGEAGTSASDYKELLASLQQDVTWFRMPENNARNVRLQTVARARTSLGQIKINVTGWPGNAGAIVCDVTANPTRTLAHLLSDHGDTTDFIAVVDALPWWLFFALAEAPITRGLGDADNWIEDADKALRCLGPDLFSVFLPIFVRKLSDLVSSVVSPRDGAVWVPDGTDILLIEPGIEIRLEFGRIRVPQIEVYFERHHGQAVAGVRAAVAAALVTVDEVTAARYEQFASHWLEREDDRLSISTKLPNDRRLLIYAKSRRRIRFEVKRLQKGDYRGVPVARAPEDRLVAILNMERENLLTACRWTSVGALFEEPDEPALGDLTRLCSLIANVCLAEGADVEPIMARLLEDGGVSRSGSQAIPPAIVERLCAVGVLDRTHLRRRDRPVLTQRVALRPEYRAVVDSIARALVTIESDNPVDAPS